jgi:hypothetical protein
MDESTRELVTLLDQASAVVQAVQGRLGNEQSVLKKNLSLLEENLTALKRSAIDGRLPRQSRGEVKPGTGLALTRTVGEWSTDQDLHGALFKIEEFYRHQF